jgi:hypothetical protein
MGTLSYAQAVMVNLGSSLISVTLLFLITRFFTPRGESKTTEALPISTASKEPLSQSSPRTAEYAKQLQQAEVNSQPALTSEEKKVRS